MDIEHRNDRPSSAASACVAGPDPRRRRDGEAVDAGRELARGLERARSLYCEDKGVGSEREWRELARERGVPCSTMNIGLNTWADTRVALENIYESCMSRGVRPPDRFNLHRRAADGPAQGPARRARPPRPGRRCGPTRTGGS